MISSLNGVSGSIQHAVEAATGKGRSGDHSKDGRVKEIDVANKLAEHYATQMHEEAGKVMDSVRAEAAKGPMKGIKQAEAEKANKAISGAKHAVAAYLTEGKRLAEDARKKWSGKA
jgi:hypothetical protein